MFVHVFGAYFGIAAARVLYTNDLENEKVSNKTGPHYHSDLFSVIGECVCVSGAFIVGCGASVSAGRRKPLDDNQKTTNITDHALSKSMMFGLQEKVVVYWNFSL